MIENLEYCDKFFASMRMRLYQSNRVPTENHSDSRARQENALNALPHSTRTVEEYLLEKEEDSSTLYLLYCIPSPAFSREQAWENAVRKFNAWLDKHAHETPPCQKKTKEQPWWLGVPRWKLNREFPRLPIGYGRVFEMHDLLGYTHREIADYLNCSMGTSKSQLHKARRRLGFLKVTNVD